MKISNAYQQQSSPEPLQVAVGVVKNTAGQVLIALRDKSLDQGGLWEFPGGKVEAAESVEEALRRELKEELGITVQTATPLITVNHHYPHLAVRLCVFMVEGFDGIAKGRQGQPLRWVDPDALAQYAFPAANLPIMTAARLPPYYAILDDGNPAMLLEILESFLNKGIKLIQARLKTLVKAEVESFLYQAYPLCAAHKAWLLLNSGVKHSEDFAADGIHLTSADLMACSQRPTGKLWVAASCHNREELIHAQTIGVDFVVLAPVLPTLTHPDAQALGWDGFAGLAAQVNTPVYALGGLLKADLEMAQAAGGQGIAGIRAFLG